MNEAGLKRYAASKRIPLGVAEKDYVLSVAIMQLSKSQYAKRFVFKGGTAIKKVYYPEARFSVDLDFDFFDMTGKELAQDLSRLFSGKKILEATFTELEDQEITNDKALLRLKYRAQLDHPDNVRLDFSFKESLLITPEWWTPRDDYDVARRMSCEHLAITVLTMVGGYDNRTYSCSIDRMSGQSDRRTCLDCKMEAPRRGEPHPSSFRTMSREEILAEKVRACLMRRRPRDLYDIWFLRSKGIVLDPKMIADKLRSYEEFKATMPSLEETKERLAPIEGERDRDLQALVPAKSYPTFQAAEEDFLKSLSESGWQS
jgi:predicted nucleotidyltransferase component of viral defense system